MVIAWLWARTVKCPNPACDARMPLIRSFQIGKKKYTLDKVNLLISDLYVEYVQFKNELITMPADFEGIRLECEIEREEAEGKVDKLKAELKMFRKSRELKKNGIQGGIDGNLKRNEILKAIVICNKYDWNEEEWMLGFDPRDFELLIGELMTSKKKAGES